MSWGLFFFTYVMVLVSKYGLERWSDYSRVSNLFCKAPDSKIWGLCTSYSFYPTTQFCRSPQTAIDKAESAQAAIAKVAETGGLNQQASQFIFLQVWRRVFWDSTSLLALWWRTNGPVQEMQFQLLGWEDPLEKELATHSSILAGKSHGQRSLVGYSPWGHRRVGHGLPSKQQQSEIRVLVWSDSGVTSLPRL